MNKIKYLLGGLIGIILLSSCSNGGVCNTSTPTPPVPDLTLQLTAPNQYPAGVEVTAYLTIFNNSEINAESLVYTVPAATNHTGVEITIDPNGNNADCTNIQSGTSCVFTAHIPAGSVPGSFTVVATPTETVTSQIAKATSITPQAQSLELTANIGLSEVPNVQGMFYIMPETKRVATSFESDTVVQLVVLVRTAQDFDSLIFVDSQGNTLQSDALGSNPLTQSAITFNVVIPAGKSLQDVMIKAQSATSDICSLDGTGLPLCSNTAYVYRQGVNTGFLSVAPRYATESVDYPTQIITLTNQGTAPITDFSMPTISAPLSLDTSYPDTCSSITTLAPNASCSFRISYDVANPDSGAQNLAFTYNDGRQTQTVISTNTYIGTTSPAYVNLVFSPEVALLSQVGESYAVQITNIGTVDAQDFEFRLSSGLYYPVYVYDEGSCSSNILADGGMCNVYLSYLGATSVNAKNLPYTAWYHDPVLADDFDVEGTYLVSYLESSIVIPTMLTRVTPENGDSYPEYYTTVELRFEGTFMDLSTVTGETVKLFANGNESIGLTAPITRVSYSGRGIPRTTVNFAIESQLYENISYTVSIPNLNAVLNINGDAVILDSEEFTTSTPLVTFTATGTSGFGYECNGEHCINILNANSTIATCQLLDVGGLVGCTASEAISGLTNTTISTAAISGLINGIHTDGMTSFVLGTTTGVFGGIDVDPNNLPYTFTQSMNMGVSLSNPTGMTVNNDLAYIINNGSIYECAYSFLGSGFTSCAALNMQGVSSNAFGVYVANPPSLGESLMVITNRDSNTVTTCVASNGTFAGVTCNTNAVGSDNTPYVFNKPYGIVAVDSSIEGNFFVFITNNGVVGRGGDDDAITRCGVSNDGGLINCHGFGDALYANPTSISLMRVPGLDEYTNVANSNGSMTTCSVGYEGVYCNRYGYANVFESSVSIMQYYPGTP